MSRVHEALRPEEYCCNECDYCGETIKPDQWSENNFTLCIDCG